MKKAACFRFGIMFCMFVLVTSGCSDYSQMDSWLAAANLEGQETPEELYQAALQEDTMILYTGSTRVYDTKAAFEKEYPGLTIEVHHIRAVDVVQKLEESFLAGETPCDVLICTDIDAVLSTRFAPQGWVYKYVPYDIEDKIIPEYNGILLEFMVEAAQIFYNTEVNDHAPVANWWELTGPDYRNRVYMVDPLRSRTTASLMVSMIEHGEEMAGAYEELYGEALLIPEGSTAGQEYWRRLLENGVIFTSSSDEAIEFVGKRGQEAPPVGVIVSSKERRMDVGYEIATASEVAPAAGVLLSNTVSIAGGAKNVSTAKLFIRYLLGETDGSGEGYQPYLQEGSWSVRTDVESKSAVSLADTAFWRMDEQFYADNSGWVREFWLGLREEYAEEQSREK